MTLWDVFCLNHDFDKINKIIKIIFYIINPVNLINLVKIVVQTREIMVQTIFLCAEKYNVIHTTLF